MNISAMVYVDGEWEEELAIGETHLVGRVCDDEGPVYVPKYVNTTGMFISERLTFTLALDNERRDRFRMVAWGEMADRLAKTCHKGRQLEVMATVQSYNSYVYGLGGEPIVQHGNKVMARKVCFCISKAYVGKESKAHIDYELSCGIRPNNWDDENHPNSTLWEEMLKSRDEAVYDGKSDTFGFAKVVTP